MLTPLGIVTVDPRIGHQLPFGQLSTGRALPLHFNNFGFFGLASAALRTGILQEYCLRYKKT